jgi:F-type H+-transporting ATPase subunit b
MLARIPTRVVVLMASVATPLVALAQEHGTAVHEEVGALPTVKQGLWTGLTAVAVFFIVLLVLGTKVWPTISKALDERADKIKGEIAAAEAARKQAKDALEQYEKSLADARAEAQRMLEKTKAQQQALADELRAKADAELAAMRDRARRDIEIAKRAAIAEIYDQAASAATSIAGKILQREVNARDQARLIEETVGQLQASRG